MISLILCFMKLGVGAKWLTLHEHSGRAYDFFDSWGGLHNWGEVLVGTGVVSLAGTFCPWNRCRAIAAGLSGCMWAALDLGFWLSPDTGSAWIMYAGVSGISFYLAFLQWSRHTNGSP